MKGTHLIVGEVSGLPRGLPFLSGSGGRRVEVGLFRVGEGEGAAVGRDAQYQLARIAAQLDVVADSPLLEGGIDILENFFLSTLQLFKIFSLAFPENFPWLWSLRATLKCINRHSH